MFPTKGISINNRKTGFIWNIFSHHNVVKLEIKTIAAKKIKIAVVSVKRVQIT